MGRVAVEQFRELKPDICLPDIQMPDSNGLYALEKIKAIDPNAGVIMLTTFDDDENIVAAYLGGADGYLLKDVLPAALAQGIQCVHNMQIALFAIKNRLV